MKNIFFLLKIAVYCLESLGCKVDYAKNWRRNKHFTNEFVSYITIYSRFDISIIRQKIVLIKYDVNLTYLKIFIIMVFNVFNLACERILSFKLSIVLIIRRDGRNK